MRIKKLFKDESGAIMVEASMYFPFVVLFMVLIIVLSIYKLNKIGQLSRASECACSMQYDIDSGNVCDAYASTAYDSSMTSGSILSTRGSTNGKSYLQTYKSLNTLLIFNNETTYKLPGFAGYIFRGTAYEEKIPSEIATSRTSYYVCSVYPKYELTRIKIAENYSGADGGLIKNKTGYTFDDYYYSSYFDFYFMR